MFRVKDLILIVLLLVLSSCSAKKEVLQELETAQSYAESIRRDAQAGKGELETALPDIKSAPARLRVSKAKGHLQSIEGTASKAKNLIGKTSDTVEEDLKDKPRFPWWLKFIIFPASLLLVGTVGISLLGRMGIPFAVSAAAWLAEKGFGLGAKIADQISIVVKGQSEDGPELTMDRLATAARADPLGNELYRRARRREALKNA